MKPALKFELLSIDLGIKWEKEVRFHRQRRWRFDYAIPSKMVYVEIDGGSWVQGRHNTGTGMAKDHEKFNHATMCGWSGFRLTSEMVNAYWLEIIKQYLKTRGTR